MALRRRRTALALRALGLGDLLTGVPALRALRRGLPDHHVVLATSPAVAPLADRASCADAVVAVSELGPIGVHGPVDITVNLHGRGPTSHTRLAEVGAVRRLGFDLPDGPQWPGDVHEVIRWGSLLESAAISFDPGDLELRGIEPAGGLPKRTTVIHPGASAVARRWPVERWAAIARRETAGGRHVLLTGSPDERRIAEAVRQAAGLSQRQNLAGATSVVALAQLVAASDRVVSTDTGIAHLAVALRTPSVTIFGPTPPSLWGPPPSRPWHRTLWAGSRGEPNAPHVDAGLLEVRVEDVAAELEILDRL